MKLNFYACSTRKRGWSGRRVAVGLALTACLVAGSIIIPTPRVAGQSGQRKPRTQVPQPPDSALPAFHLSAVDPPEEIELCQAVEPASLCMTCGVDGGCRCRHRSREDVRAIVWQEYAQGEYVEHARLPEARLYRLRIGDELDVVYRQMRRRTLALHKLNAGDKIRIESNLPEDLRTTLENRHGRDVLGHAIRIAPEGTISLPILGAVQAHGLTLRELQDELSEQYREHIAGIVVIPVLARRASRYVYVAGEVACPGRYELTGPTSVTEAIAMAGSGKPGAHLQQVVVFRHGDDWRLLATVLDLRTVLEEKQPALRQGIWLSDSDVIIVPKSPILVADDFIERVFSQGVYGEFPLDASLSFAQLSTL